MNDKQSFFTNKNIIYMCIALILAAFLLYRFTGNLPQVTTQPQKQTETLTQTNAQGDVTIKVTPKTLAPNSQVIFDITFNTHSVELDYDISQIAKLTDDAGNSYKPLSWTGGKGGHHLEGLLTFPTISLSAKKVTLTIPNIDNLDRVFSWDLK